VPGPRVDLILDVRGLLGGVWLAGALHAIASECGVDRGSARTAEAD